MPTYEYVCSKCDHQFERIQPITDEPLAICPKALCGQKRWGKGKVKRAVGGGAGLIFKGSGFYITDYRSENYKKGAKKESGSTTPPAGDTKPAPAKTETQTSKPSSSGASKPSRGQYPAR